MRAFCSLAATFQSNGNEPVFLVSWQAWDGVNAPTSGGTSGVVSIDDNADTVRAKMVNAVASALSIPVKDVVLI
jgi:hypothetical protein